MSNERRIYKYQGTLIGDDRVDSIDIDKLNTITPYLSYNSDTNTFEIGNNLYVSGSIISHYSPEAFVIIDENNATLTFSFEQGNALVIKNEYQSGIYFDDFDDSGELVKGATSFNLKTIFGKYLLKEPEQPENDNIDLYRHQLTLTSATNTYVGVIYLLDNTPITSTQLLTTYTKATNGYLFLAVKVTGPVESQYAIGIGYTNNQWATTVGDAITNVSDIVRPL